MSASGIHGDTRNTLSDRPIPESIGAWAKELMRRCIFKIVPVEVPNSRREVERGNMCLRKTLSGVDLNRNWPVGWKANRMGHEEYGGSSAFSEPESRILRDIGNSWAPHTYVQTHSGEWALYTPWDHKALWGSDLPADTRQLLKNLNVHCGCVNGAAGEVSGYLAFGSSMDYFYQELKTPYPITVEVFGPSGTGKLPHRHARHMLQKSTEFQHPESLTNSAELEVDSHDEGYPQRSLQQRHAGGVWGAMELQCFRWFNPESQNEYQEVVGRWVSIFMMLADHVATSVESGRVVTKMPERQPVTTTPYGRLRGGSTKSSVNPNILDTPRLSQSKATDTSTPKATVPTSEQVADVSSLQRSSSSTTTATPAHAQLQTEADTPEVLRVPPASHVHVPATPTSTFKSNIYKHIENRVGVMLIAWSWLFILLIGCVLVRSVRRWRTHRRALEGRDVRL